jgi:hypothetical protein
MINHDEIDPTDDADEIEPGSILARLARVRLEALRAAKKADAKSATKGRTAREDAERDIEKAFHETEDGEEQEIK